MEACEIYDYYEMANEIAHTRNFFVTYLLSLELDRVDMSESKDYPGKVDQKSY